MRRAQMEMVGLVFIVILVVVGIVMYLQLSVPNVPLVSQSKLQGVTSFIVALKETTIPDCGTSFERVVAACLENRPLCTSQNPCREAEQTMELLAETMLLLEGYKYNLSVGGLQAENRCKSGDRRVELMAAPRVPIVYAGGAQENLVLAICR